MYCNFALGSSSQILLYGQILQWILLNCKQVARLENSQIVSF